eukprot:5370952-Pyramimonas_sp.AAC.1
MGMARDAKKQHLLERPPYDALASGFVDTKRLLAARLQCFHHFCSTLGKMPFVIVATNTPGIYVFGVQARNV